MAGLLNISLTGLNAAQAALNTTSHNISNASVAGYNRQQVVQSASTPLFSGVGFFGQGTQIDTVKRVYSQFLTAQVLAADTSRAEYETYYNEIKQVDNLLSNTSSGLSSALDSFFVGVQQVAADPSSVPSRQSMLSSSEALVSRFHSLQSRFDEIRDGVESQIAQSVDQVNTLARKISDLNQKIVTAQSAGTNVPANDLLDQRDAAVADLNAMIKVSTSTNSDGTVNVFIGSGQPLVMNTDVFTLSTAPSDADPGRLAVGIQLPSGGTVAIQESLLTGGTLGGLLRYRSESLDPAQNALGRIALGMVTLFNAQHKLGQDLSGNMGGNYFNALTAGVQNLPNLTTGTTSTAAVSATVTSVGGLSTSDYVLSYDGTNYSLARTSDGAVLYTGSSMPGNSVTQTTGTSGATFSITATANATGNAENYSLSYDGTNYTVKSAASGKTLYTGSLPTTLEGINISLASGTPAAGDVFALSPAVEGLQFSGSMAVGDRVLIQPTRNAARDISVAIKDTSLIAAGSPVRSVAASTNTGTGAVSQPIALSLNGIQASATAHLTTPVKLTFDAATNQFNVSGATPSTIAYNPSSNAAGTTISLTDPNLSFQISGRPADGDSFTLETNVGGTKDGRNANALYALASGKSLLGGTATLGYAYSQLVSSVGTQTNSAKINQEAQTALLEQATAEQQNLSGVNLDEEAANLLRYQQAYQACARAIGIAGTLFDDILSVMR
ncbi:flagellar hook-associated protein FlgK [Uliginosibacterium paludis]|uniref:Flagellar hook-associated protein 1 n=1 Tax=Uliginosibacterium paludis TaxID=1615952 RepID=A0ABV2CLA7_9RHOO